MLKKHKNLLIAILNACITYGNKNLNSNSKIQADYNGLPCETAILQQQE